jgi:hypothetical protein
MPFFFMKTSLLKLEWAKLLRFCTKESPADLKIRSHAAENINALLNSLNI